jgi:hypothetical protein
MLRLLGGLALVSLLLSGCASAPKSYSSGFYDAPALAYTLDMDSPAFREGVTLFEQCDNGGGTLNIWDGENRFFRIDYLKINKSPLAQVPAFATERTITDLVLAGYIDRVLPKAKGVQRSEVLLKEFVTTRGGNALFSILNMTVSDAVLPKGVSDTSYYYGFLIFQRGDFSYIIQHRSDTYQPDRLKDLLVSLAGNMKIPGNPREDLEAEADDDSIGQGSIWGYFLKNHLFRKSPGKPDTTLQRCQ